MESDQANPGDSTSRRRAGGLDALSLVEMLRALATAGRTGLLTVSRGGRQERHIYFQDGVIKIVGASHGEQDPLEQALLESESFAPEEVTGAREEAARYGKSLAHVLLERGASRGLDASGLLDSRTRRETAEIAGWREARCRFAENAPPPAGSEAYATRLSGGIDPREVLPAAGRNRKPRRTKH
jgi:hypothetical protein